MADHTRSKELFTHTRRALAELRKSPLHLIAAGPHLFGALSFGVALYLGESGWGLPLRLWLKYRTWRDPQLARQVEWRLKSRAPERDPEGS
jgi:hypothetical protein